MLLSLVHRHCCKYSIVSQIVRHHSAESSKFDVHDIKHKSKVPAKPTVSLRDFKTEKIAIETETIELLQRLALVNLSDQ